MAEAISNTSPLFYLHQIGTLDWLPRLFSIVWISADIRRRVLALADERAN